jgi:hypothetical protein
MINERSGNRVLNKLWLEREQQIHQSKVLHARSHVAE